MTKPICVFCGTDQLLGLWYGNTLLDNIRETLLKKQRAACSECIKNIMQIMDSNHRIKELT